MGTKAGHTKYIETPERLWDLFHLFMQWVKDNPYLVQDYVGKDGIRVDREKQRPLTFIGFEKYLALEEIVSDLSSYEKNLDNRYELYVPIVSRIRKICNGEIIEGASAGVYNAMIASRVASLIDRSEQTVKEEPRIFKID